MYKKAIVTMGNGTTSRSLVYDLDDSDLSQKWAQCVIDEGARGLHIHEDGWFHGFPNMRLPGEPGKVRNRQTLSDQMNKHIETIEQYFPGKIPERAYPEMPQEHLNKLHHYFELYRGPVDDPRFMWVDGNEDVRNALEKFNEVIHRFEAYYRNETAVKPRVSVMHRHTDFNIRRKRFELEDQHYNFELNRFFGQLYLKYCIVGKQVMDVFFDQDNEIFDDNVVPLHMYTCDYDIFFGEPWSPEAEAKIRADLEEFLSAREMDINDPKLSLGYCTMATLNKDESGFEGMTNDEIRNELFVNNMILSTEIMK